MTHGYAQHVAGEHVLGLLLKDPRATSANRHHALKSRQDDCRTP